MSKNKLFANSFILLQFDICLIISFLLCCLALNHIPIFISFICKQYTFLSFNSINLHFILHALSHLEKPCYACM